MYTFIFDDKFRQICISLLFGDDVDFNSITSRSVNMGNPFIPSTHTNIGIIIFFFYNGIHCAGGKFPPGAASVIKDGCTCK